MLFVDILMHAIMIMVLLNGFLWMYVGYGYGCTEYVESSDLVEEHIKEGELIHPFIKILIDVICFLTLFLVGVYFYSVGAMVSLFLLWIGVAMTAIGLNKIIDIYNNVIKSALGD